MMRLIIYNLNNTNVILVNKDALLKQADALKKTSYGEYLTRVAGGYK